MRIEYSRSAAKALKDMDKTLRLRIHAGIEGLTEKPARGDIKMMQGFKETIYRLRVGGWRVIYQYRQDGTVEILSILDIGARGDVYKAWR